MPLAKGALVNPGGRTLTFRGEEKPLKVRGRLADKVADQPLPYLTDRSVGIGTWTVVVWLPGFIGPYPSTSLDKSLVVFSCYVCGL
jgi:hypothetical protein